MSGMLEQALSIAVLIVLLFMSAAMLTHGVRAKEVQGRGQPVHCSVHF